MDSRGPVRHLSKTVCLVTLLLATEAGAGIDTPGWVSFHFLAEPDAVYQRFDQVPGAAPLSPAHARAFFSTDASSFEDTGVRIWAGFDLTGPDGGQGRHAMLILDLDLTKITTPLKENAVRAEYLETRDDRVLFEGYPLAVEVRIWDIWHDGGDSGALEGEFEVIFFDPADQTQGSRVLVTGHFGTDTTPNAEKQERDVYTENNTYVETGCESEVYIEDDYEDSGCGGSDDYDYGGSSDCEGDTYDSSSDSGCEGDTYDSSYSDSSSCEGDGYDSYDSSAGGDCEGDEAFAAVLKPAPRRRRTNPLRAVMRMFPEIAGISFIVYMKRRFRAGR